MITPLPRARLVPMRPRDPSESGRTASTLELFFDLVFVVAVSIASVDLAHELEAGHVVHGVASYAAVFFAIWWAWMNFTWFASSFDTDDWLYRVTTIVQMAGVLLLAAGVGDAFSGDFALVTFGYVVMRLAMVAQWLRASRHGGPYRRTAQVYAVGITIVQVLWLIRLALPEELLGVSFVVMALAEISVPLIAERSGMTPWHPYHISERYGLFTLILLGESLLASTNAIIEGREEDAELASLISLAVIALLVTAAMWWIYFWPPHHHAVESGSFQYGYVHYFVFAAAGAFSAGIEVEIASLLHHSELGEVASSFTVTVPIAVFVLGIWWLAIRQSADRVVNVVVPVGALLVLADPLIPIPITLTAVVMAVVVAVLVARPPVTSDEAAH